MRYILFMLVFVVGGVFGYDFNDPTGDEPDSREIDLKNEQHQQYLSEQSKQWIMDAQAQMENEGMLRIWQDNERYAEGLQIPLGFSDDYLQELVKKATTNGAIDATKFRVQKTKNGKLFFVDNKIGTIVDAMTGEYTDAKKVITVKTDANAKNNGIEGALRKYLEAFEERKRLWERIRVPSVENMMIYGLWWVYLDYNPRINNGYGDIEYRLYSCRDVLVDPKAKEKYFENAQYLVLKERMEFKKAVKFLKKYKIAPEKIMQDNDYEYFSQDERYTKEVKGRDRFVTFYKILYKKVYTEEIPLKDNYEGGEWLKDIGEEKIEVEKVYHYEMLYNRHLGVLYHKDVTKYTDQSALEEWQFKAIPYYNKQSRVRLYPYSEVEKLKTIQDIINISESIIMNNARDREKFRAIIHSKLRDEYGQLFEDFVKIGGFLPVDMEALDGKLDDYFKEVKFEETGQDLLKFFEISKESLKDQSIAHESLQGNYPDKGSISGVAVQRLQQANLRKLNYKDVNINWAVTTEARTIYRMISEEFAEPEFVAVDNAKKGEPGRIPIQTTMTLKEYEQFLTEVLPDMDIMQAAEIFEKENDVQYQIGMIDENGRVRTVEEIKAGSSVVYINFLKNIHDEPYAMDIKVNLDFATERDELQELVEYAELWKSGGLALIEYYKKRWPDRADEMYKSWLNEKGLNQLSEAINKLGPNGMDMAQQILQRIMAAKSGPAAA